MYGIGKKIKSFRQQKGWSQGDIAALLKISVPAFSKIESDVTDMSMSRLKQIADVLEVPVINLISEDDEKPSQTLLDELQEAKKIVAAHALKINQLQEYIITLYEQINKHKQNVASN